MIKFVSLCLCSFSIFAQELFSEDPVKSEFPKTEDKAPEPKAEEELPESNTEEKAVEAKAEDTKPSEDTESKEGAESRANKKKKSKKKPLRITASTSTYNSKEGKAIFKENVVVEDVDFYLECDEMHVFYRKATKDQPGGIERIIAIRNVKIKQTPNTASSDRAVYLLADQTITLTGNPILTGDDGQKMKSDHFIIHRDSEVIESGPVTIESAEGLQ